MRRTRVSGLIAVIGGILILAPLATPRAMRPPGSDFDGDGRPDVLWRDYVNGENSVWIMSGTAPREFRPVQAVPDLNWELAGSGDFNGDGRLDLLWRNHRSGENSIWMRTANGTFDFQRVQEVPDLAWQIGGVGDFDGDDRDDILWRHLTAGDNSIWIMNGSQPREFVTIRKVEDLAWQMSGSGDFNGDGKADILWRNYRTGDNSIWMMNGREPIAFTLIQKQDDVRWQMAGSADLNGDGKSDILWRHYDTGDNSAWLMNGSTVTSFVRLPAQKDPRWQMAGTRSTGHPLIVRGAVECPKQGMTAIPAAFAHVGVKGADRTISDVNGRFRTTVPSDTPAYELRLFYEGAVPTNLTAGATPLQVMNDGHTTRSDVATRTPVGRNPFSRDLGTITFDTIDCEAWRLGVAVLGDYHLVRKTAPPAARLRIKRWENVLVGTPLTFYDYVTIPTDFMTQTEYPDPASRLAAMFHEFGHSIRHVADGDERHWHDDNTAFIYAQDHNRSTTIHNKPYAFNEGWATFWEYARAGNHTDVPVNGGCVALDVRDWNEGRVANTLLALRKDLRDNPRVRFMMENIAPKPAPDVFLDAWLLDVLICNPGRIHSLENYLARVAERIPGFAPTRVTLGGVPGCPSGFADDGLFCRRDAQSVVKPATGCACGYHDHGPTCFRNSLIFRDF